MPPNQMSHFNRLQSDWSMNEDPSMISGPVAQNYDSSMNQEEAILNKEQELI